MMKIKIKTCPNATYKIGSIKNPHPTYPLLQEKKASRQSNNSS